MSHANVAVFVPHIGCPNRCSFCDQNSITGSGSAPDGSAVREICETALRGMRARGADNWGAQLAFFGGSFTAIDPGLMIELLEAAQPFLGAKGFAGGIRVSTRPDAVDDAALELLARYGVRAVELGAQSMDDRVLALNRRGHTARDVVLAARRVKEHGLELGLQMMTGLYGDTDEGAINTARLLADCKPDTVRIYPTVVLRGTYLEELWASGVYQPPNTEEAVPLCAALLRFFEGRGIRVIRLGLHASRAVEQGMLAGAYHPAMRELCESRLYLEDVLNALAAQGIPPGALLVRVARGCRSKAVGQRKSNVCALRERGFRVTITEDETLAQGQVHIERQQE